MTFKDILSEVIDWLRQDKRITYRALKRQFDLDDDYLDDLKDELIEAKQIAKDENGRVLVWIGEAGDIPPSTSQPDQPETQPVVEQAEPVQETPSSVEPHTTEAERRQLTVMFVTWLVQQNSPGDLTPKITVNWYANIRAPVATL
jgi:hypothetical protein